MPNGALLALDPSPEDRFALPDPLLQHGLGPRVFHHPDAMRPDSVVEPVEPEPAVMGDLDRFDHGSQGHALGQAGESRRPFGGGRNAALSDEQE